MGERGKRIEQEEREEGFVLVAGEKEVGFVGFSDQSGVRNSLREVQEKLKEKWRILVR